ncbi:DUF1569 domain-containing protein [Psychroserpens sp.]|uniref:DUF1569 domain-containing protein n=1 Tax=Psychroserpens sp. TaxID=2020870 RepID=UPI001B22B879|nr:DUF1569 domain-containing protein [Psychroserpens sp.]MBO6605604.1 DUF1569 domain-containing protein [Psychroserpens sp.]MBO6631840.1 DUF1569 domain-containing protein [Psychroserpens sp.]MBO6653587.1 DUF1569 domain-containing protein [Psychroserpens sp.]MBO6681908.1 DUF1569 domain-containing protein [Psychroserpens sp.]MBO6748978.1 DUF1569 domain-containing protein [Psychroserpens sp.]
MNSTNKLLKLIDELEARIPHASMSNETISKVNVSWHLDHSVKVIIGISKQLIRSDISDYKSNFNLSRFILFPVGYIPRGRGKSPKVVLPPDAILIEDIKTQLETAKDLVLQLKSLPQNANFKHYVFGILNKSKAIRFIEMHTKHHLKIVDDIRN